MCTKIKLIKSKLFLFCAILSSFFFLSCIFGIKTELNAPKNVKVSNITSNSAVVSWSSVKHAASYEVMWTIKGKSEWSYDIIPETSILLMNLDFDQEYTVQVCANPEGADSMIYCSSEYKSINFKTPLDETPDGQFARPANITASLNQEKTEITVGWDSVEGASYYDVNFEFEEGYAAPVKYRIAKTVPASQTEFVYKDTMYGNAVNIKVAARNSDFSDSCRWSKEIHLSIK